MSKGPIAMPERASLECTNTGDGTTIIIHVLTVLTGTSVTLKVGDKTYNVTRSRDGNLVCGNLPITVSIRRWETGNPKVPILFFSADNAITFSEVKMP